ncbi:MAG: tripartite tricarboxylate transporter substrate binding protein [Burkholderiales bacterium]|nr:tripartite tricarboxylate transporter substrate binding protein [Burkholderiales bacterium]
MRVSVALLCLAGPFLSTVAAAQGGFPSKPIRFVVGYGPGSTLDIMARTLGPHLHTALGQPVIVDNRPGGGGRVGTDAVAKAAPDGHTLAMTALGPLAVNPNLYPNSPFDPVKDFAAVTLIATGPVAVVVHPALPVKSVKDLVALAKSKPGALNFGSPGIGTSTHLAGELFKIVAGIDLVHVPYKGNAEALNELVGGQVPIVFSGVPPVVSLAQAGRVRILATTGKTRLAAFPQAETMSEAGYPGAALLIWYGVAVPGATPKAIVTRLHDELVRIMALPEVRDRFVKLGVDPETSSSAEFAKLIRDEVARWGKVIKTANIRVN